MTETVEKVEQKTPNDVLVEHADRLWNAECENASRLAERIHLISGASVGLLGIGLFGVEWLYYVPASAICPPWVTLAIHLLLIGVVLLLTTTLAVMYLKPGNPRPPASDLMAIEKADRKKPTKGIVFRAVYDAYLSLRERNARERARLRKGQELFSWAIGLIFLSILIYLVGSLPAKMHPDKGSSDEQHNTAGK